jgi:putative redox protein
MVVCENEEARYRVIVSNGRHEISADMTEDKGGGGSGIRPHELLESALAACLNMTIRMHAEKKGIAMTKIITKVSADRAQPGKTTFKYSFSFEGTLTDEQHEELSRVRKTLSNAINFVKDV